MPEQTFALKPVGVDYICDKCGQGKMLVRGNSMLLTNPPQWTHECNHCGGVKNLTEKYPTVRFERADADGVI